MLGSCFSSCQRIEAEREQQRSGIATLPQRPEPAPGSIAWEIGQQHRKAIEARRKAADEREERQRRHLERVAPELEELDRKITAVGVRIEEENARHQTVIRELGEERQALGRRYTETYQGT